MSNQEKENDMKSEEKEIKTRKLFEPMPDPKTASLEDLEKWAENAFRSTFLVQKFKEFFSKIKKSN